MTIRQWAKVLIGDRAAIEAAAASSTAWIAGLLWVLLAGIAREYDGEYLGAEPWHAVIPLGVSWVAATLLYLLLRASAWRADAQGRRGSYRSFLGLFWLTAPLATLYAIPYERFMSEYQATAANLATLGVVAVWRVVLMSRIVAVVTGAGVWSAVFVLGYASVVVVAISIDQLGRVVSIMGGVRTTPTEALLRDVVLSVFQLGVLGGGACWLAVLSWWVRPRFMDWRPLSAQAQTRISGGVWGVTGLGFALGVAGLVWAQPEQALRYRVEVAWRGDRWEEALERLGEHPLEAYPPHWSPPPNGRFVRSRDEVVRACDAAVVVGAPEWVRAHYEPRFCALFEGDPGLLEFLVELDPGAMRRVGSAWPGVGEAMRGCLEVEGVPVSETLRTFVEEVVAGEGR